MKVSGLVFAALLACCASAGQAQDARTERRYPSVNTDLFVGFGGGGPSGVTLRGLEVGAVLSPYVALGVEGSLWDHGNGPCTGAFPSPCTGSGRVALVTLTISPILQERRLSPYASAQVGFHDFSGVRIDDDNILVRAGWRPALGADVGVDLRIVGPLGARMGMRYLDVFDDEDYAEAIERHLYYKMFHLGLTLRWP